MAVSMKQQPVVDRLVILLSTAKDVAAAISDNAIEENKSLDQDALLLFSRDLNSIKDHLHTAYDIPMEES
jgi:predicted transcriptional regulator